MNSKEFKNTCKELCKKIVNLENTECIVCHNEIKVGTLLLPCNHYQMCFTCSSTTDMSECFICRTKVEHIVNYSKSNEYLKDIHSLTDSINYYQYLTSISKNNCSYKS